MVLVSLVQFISLKRCNEFIELLNSLLGGSRGRITVSRASSDVHFLNGLEERLGGLLLRFGGSKTSDSTTSFVHVTTELINDIEPFLPGNVAIEQTETLLGLGNDGLFADSKVGVLRVVNGVGSVTVYRIRGVGCGGLIASISGTLRVTGSVSDKSENRESWRLADSSVGDDRDESGTSSDLGKGLAAGLLR